MGKTAGGVKAIELEEGDKVVNMFLHKDEPFILVHGKKNGKLLNLEDLKVRKRARRGQIIMTGNDKIQGGISIVEGAVRIRHTDGTMTTLHSNNISLDEPETPLCKMAEKDIEMIYRPWEEKEENLKYKEEKKKAEKEAKKQNKLIDEEENETEESDETQETE